MKQNLRIAMNELQRNTPNVLPANANRNQSLFQQLSTEYLGRGVVCTPGYLRAESILGNGQSIDFDVTQVSNQQAAPTERRLKQNDVFVVTTIALYIANVATNSVADRSNMILRTFPNPEVFGASAAPLQSFYNGFLSLRMDSTVFIDSVPVQAFYRVGTSQQQAAAANQNNVSRDEWDTALYGRNEITPTFRLNGRSTIDWSVTLPSAQNLAGPTTTINIAALVLGGILCQGAASIGQS